MLVHNQIFSFNRKPLKENQNSELWDGWLVLDWW